MKPINNVNFNIPIIYLTVLSDGRLVVIDSKTTIHFLNNETFHLCGGFKGNIPHKGYKQNVVSFSSDSKYLVSLDKEHRKSIFINLENKKIYAKFSRHQGEVSVVSIDPLNRYLFSCGDDGKIFALDITNGKLAFVLPMHKDRVNDITFSKDGNWCISVGYDKKVHIFNISTMKMIHSLPIHSSPIMKTSFIDSSRAVTIDKSLSCVIVNIYSGDIITRLSGLHDDPSSICSDSKFLFIGTVLGYIIVYDLKEYKMITKQYIKLTSSITQLKFINNKLFVATADGDLSSYHIYQGEDILRGYLQTKDYKSVQTLLSKNIFLKYTSAYIRFKNIWEESLKKAKDALEKGDMKRVNTLFKDFKHIQSKNKVITQLLDDYKDFEIFREYIHNGKITLAYNVLNMHPEYKNSKMYNSLELRWQKTFLQAQMVLSTPRGLDKANNILKPYRGIAQKTIYIQALIKEYMVYEKFKLSLAKEEYKIVFKYIKLYPFLKEFPEYKELLNYAELLHKKSTNLIQKGQYNSAIKLLLTLQYFDDFKDEADNEMNNIKINQRFFEAVENNNLQLAYKLLDSNFKLNETDSGKVLQQKWNESLQQANIIASHGNINQLDSLLKNYFNISSRYLSLANLYSYYYSVELERGIRAKKEKPFIEKGIKKYILFFGLDSKIINFYNIYKKYYKNIDINLKSLEAGILSSWKPSMIVNSIFI